MTSLWFSMKFWEEEEEEDKILENEILENDSFVMTGTGLEFSLPEQTLDIFTNSSFSSKATEDWWITLNF